MVVVKGGRDNLSQRVVAGAAFPILILKAPGGGKMKNLYRSIAALSLAFLMAAAAWAQAPAGKKSFTFHGKVEAVAADGLTVNGEKVEGWMDAMTMKYKVDDPKILKKVKAGDEITATVYEGDTSLHKVQVAAKSK
jgi:Cu/Ag efflux protein CusF